MKFALKLVVAGFLYLLVLAAYAQEKAAEPVKDVEGVIRRVIEGVKGGAPGATKPGEKKKDEEAVEVPRAPVVELGPKFIRLHLQDGSELREPLLTLSDADMAFSYGLLETPIPLLNDVAHVRLSPVTDGDRTFWLWESRFDTPPGREEELRVMVAENVYQSGIDAVRCMVERQP